MNVPITFLNVEQEKFYYHKERNGEFDGGFNNGKSYVACERGFTHLATFPNYGLVIARQKYKVLRSTTMKTFFKICPNEFVYRHSDQDGYTVLRNRSFIYWMHLDEVDEQDIRGLEINSCLIDQAEEISESIYLVMDARVGRWDNAKVPLWLLRAKLTESAIELANKIEREQPKELANFIRQATLWPRHKKRGHFLVPNYMDILCNPSEEDEFHWNYRYYNPLSLERKANHFYIHRESDKDLTDEQTYEQMLTRDKEWVDKYVKGKTGSPKSQIHKVNDLSIIKPGDYDPEIFKKFMAKLINRSALFRVLDHGDTGWTAVGWVGVLNKCHIFYREYYEEGQLISSHRQNLADLTGEEEIVDNFADPSIFKEDRQKIGGMQQGFWSVAKEYMDEEVCSAPPIHWSPADNNELATRNRINELLTPSVQYHHPITLESPAPAIYFIQKCEEYPNGCEQIILQTKQQRKLLVAEINGKKIYSVDRDEKIVDHAYDLVRYHIGEHLPGKPEEHRKVPERSFEAYNRAARIRRVRAFGTLAETEE